MAEFEYCCDVKNKFHGCSEASDPFELLSSKKNLRPKGKKDKATEKQLQGSSSQKDSKKLKQIVSEKFDTPKLEPKSQARGSENNNHELSGDADSHHRGGMPGRFPRAGSCFANAGANSSFARNDIAGYRADDVRSSSYATFNRGNGGRRTGAGGFEDGGVGCLEEDRRHWNDLQSVGGDETMHPNALACPSQQGNNFDGAERRPSNRSGGPFRGGFGPGRQFERQSDTWSAAAWDDMRHGGGSDNWNEETCIDMGEEQFGEGDQPEQLEGGQNVAEGKVKDQRARALAPVQMTLDEYRRQQRKLRADHTTRRPEARKAGEGEDPGQWSTPVTTYQKKPDASECTKYNSLKREVVEIGSDDNGTEDGSIEDEMAKISQSLTDTMFVSKTLSGGYRLGRRGGRFGGAERGGCTFEDNNRIFHSRQDQPHDCFRRDDRMQGEDSSTRHGFSLPPDPSEFPELC